MLNLNLNWVSETIKTIKDWWPVVKSNFQQIQNNYNSHISGTSDKHLAEHITYSGVVSGASNVKQGIDNIKNSYNGHVNGESDKHAAEHITFASNRLTLPDDNVKNAIETVDTRIEQIIQGQSIDPNKDVEVLASRTSSIYGEFPTLTERLDNADTIINDINAKIDAPDYSAPQEVTDSVITLPDDVVEGQFSDITLKGRTLSTLVPNNYGDFETDSNSDGVADGYTSNFTGATASLDTTWKIAGSKSQKFTNVTTGQLKRDITVKANNTYLLVVDAKVAKTSGSASAVVLQFGYVENGAFVGSYKTLSISEGQKHIVHKFTTSASPVTPQIWFANVSGRTDEVLTINIDAYAMYDLTAMGLASETEANLTPYMTFVNGTKSTNSVRLKSINKNFFEQPTSLNDYKNYDENKLTIQFNSDNITYTSKSTYAYASVSTKDFKVKPNTSYSLSVDGYVTGGYKRVEVLEDNNIIAFVSLDTTRSVKTKLNFITGASGNICVRFYVTGSTAEVASMVIYSVQIEEGIIATEYEPNKSTEAYIDEVGGSLPNGTYDEINVTQGKNTIRTKKKILEASDITAMYTSYTNIDYARIPRPDDWLYKTIISGAAANVARLSATLETYSNKTIDGGYDDTAWINYVDFGADGNYIWVGFPKGTTLEQARTALAGKSLIYQLATPITHEGTSQSLIAYPKGHLIIECVKRVTKSYDNGIIVDTPIETIESVTKVEDGERIPIDLSKVTVAGNKLSFTITGATKNEVYEVIYHYNGVLPTVRFSYTQNVAAAIDGNTKGVAANSKAINDFIAYQNAVNLQFDLRITALEP